MSRITLTTAAATLALAGSCLATGPAGAADATSPGDANRTAVRTLASGLMSPLSLAVADNGTRYVAQNFAGLLQKQIPGKPAKTIYAKPNGWEVGAVSVRDGKVRFAITKGTTALLLGIDRGRRHVVADLARYEATRNPDRGVEYGFRNLGAECAAQLPGGMPASYQGIVESHPYATAQGANGVTYVADAAGNDILSVGPNGKVRTVAVLPSVPLKVSAQFAESAELPACTVGQTYHFEPVPTDVEVGPNGMLYVSTLPGGPEDGSMGANATVYRINPRTGAVGRLAGGLVSATGLAVGPRGHVLVAELFANRISVIAPGSHTARPWAGASMPGDIEWARGGVFGTTDVMTGMSGQPGDVPNGKVVKFRR
ncbi:MAG: ScyD/ScyE family protein [Nocardioidaceae bacterium]|nr:ScyD/ScyE family protein [Nocardioidaceae bacterium]